MGFYVNPPDESKESFLEREGIAAPNNPRITWESVPEGFLPVVLMSNGRFTTAGIAYKKSELDEFTRLDDNRPRRIYMVRIDKLVQVSDPDFEDYAKEHGLISVN